MRVEAREADGSSLGPGSSSAVLDFIASTATLDRYHEVIEPTGWRLESYRRNPVFQNAHNYGVFFLRWVRRFRRRCGVWGRGGVVSAD
jgi:hypothetical protein